MLSAVPPSSPEDSEGAAERLRRSEERSRAYVQQSSEGIWCFEMRSPVVVTLPIDEQIAAIDKLAYLAECNDAMARMYGYDRAAELIGRAGSELLPLSDPHNEAFLHAFVEAGYRLMDAESHER